MVATVLALLIAQLGIPAGQRPRSVDEAMHAIPAAFPPIDQVAQNPASVEQQLQTEKSAGSQLALPRDQPTRWIYSEFNPFGLIGYQQPVVEELPWDPLFQPEVSSSIAVPSPLSDFAVTPSPVSGMALPPSVFLESEVVNNHVDNARSFNLPRRLANQFFRRHSGPDFGIGYERVMFAPMVLDTAISSPYVGLRVRADYGLSAPDRLEYVWAKAGRGPGPETRLDLIDTVYRSELGNAQAALITELSMRSLNPEQNGNTVGFGDMVVGGKALVYDGKCTKLSTLFLTYLKTGSPSRGLGTGHVALEPGVLLRHKMSDATYFHSELKYRLPIAASDGFGGDLLTSGYALSTVWKDTDQYAVMPTLEVTTTSFLFGARTLEDGTVQRVNGTTAVDIYPGMRCVFSNSNAGTWEAGFSAGVTCFDRDWFDSRFVIDLRWLW